MSPSPLPTFLDTHHVQVGDRVRVEWKNTHLEGTILPFLSNEGVFLTLKLSSGYNTGLAIRHISKLEKVPSPEKSAIHLIPPHPPLHPLDDTKPAISLIGVGGTIASKVNYEKGGVSAKMTPTELSEIVPEVNAFAQIKYVISPFTKMSEDNLPSDWQAIAEACHAELSKPDVSGVLVTHGTDTLHYTAAALSFMLPDLSKPVVLVGSQRSSDRGSSDAYMNLVCASRVAVSDMAEVGICMHATTSDEYCLFIPGTSVRKMHTSRRDAFRPINRIPFARVWPDGKLEKMSSTRARSNVPTKLDTAFEPHVAIVKMFPGQRADIFDYYVSKGCKGFIIEATGLGHVHTDMIPTIRGIVAKGIPVFITPQTIYGRINLDVYTNLRLLQEAGAVGLEDMLTETAYVKLGWVLGHTKDLAQVKKRMLTPTAGDISPASRVDAFLQ